MILYRIARERHALDLTGKGGLISSARWHDRKPVIYTSLSSSTAILEKLVHLQISEIHNDLVMVKIEVPEGIATEKIEIAQLPDNWKTYPAPNLLQRIGNAWLDKKSALLLYIPSAVDPLAINVIINPLHTAIKQVSIIKTEPFRFDERFEKAC